MRIDLAQLEDTRLTYAATALELEADASLPEGYEISLRLFKKGSEVHVHGSIKAVFRISCVRCLTAVEFAVNNNFRLLYLPIDNLRADSELVLHEDDLNVSFYSEMFIDIEELATEQLRLLLPMSIRCSESCKGLCQSCGKNLNLESCECTSKEIDPRWQALLKFKR
ncbi:MAG: DUF177 domain-containing protein [Acidobacteriota bacterium]|nr:DUF177 domain-containing protein [Blastocatellia bacterium]MDW8412969.1 DUF177 domain-containing protein [Acidobacteriota bacterium]